MKEKLEVQMWKIFLKQNSTSAVFRGNNVLNITLRIEKILNKETTTFSLQDMFRHSYVIFSCKCDFNGCTFSLMLDIGI